MNLKFKSSDADLSFKSIMVFLDLMNKNILYQTHQTDKCLALLRKLEVDAGVQKQVDDFYETSPQTEPDEQ